MRVETREHGEVTVLALFGELIGGATTQLNEAVEQAFDRQMRDFLVDLSEVTVVDSAGLESLTALQRRCEEQLGMVRFCGADDTLRKVFEITRLDGQLMLHESMEEALVGFNG